MPTEVPDPDLPIVDPHHHLYPAHHPAFPRGRYMIEDLEADCAAGHRIDATIYVECSFLYRASGPQELRPLGEAAFVDAIGRLSETGLYGPARICAGFIGAADLTLGDRVETVLDGLAEASGGRLRGIRGTANRDDDPGVNTGTRPFAPAGLLSDPRWREGVRRMARRGLVYDAWQYHPQTAELAGLVDAVPEMTFVVNHCGGLLRIGPYDRAGVHGEWLAQMTAIAKRPNVAMKLGGLSGRRCGFGYDRRPEPGVAGLVADWRPWIEPLVELFGPDRCMFESNFPVDRASADYRTLWTVFKTLAAGASDAEKRALFAGTARRIYGLEG